MSPAERARRQAQNEARQRQRQQNALNRERQRASQGPPKGLPAPGKGLTPGQLGGIPIAQGGTLAPAAPAPPPPPVWAPDAGYNEAIGLAKKRYDQTITSLGGEERRTKFEFGFEDPTNPFSRVAEAKKAFLGRGRQITGNLGAEGQLYSGYHQASRAANARAETRQLSEMRQAYQALLDNIRTRRTGAQTTREEEELQARLDSMGRQGVTS